MSPADEALLSSALRSFRQRWPKPFLSLYPASTLRDSRLTLMAPSKDSPAEVEKRWRVASLGDALARLEEELRDKGSDEASGFSADQLHELVETAKTLESRTDAEAEVSSVVSAWLGLLVNQRDPVAGARALGDPEALSRLRAWEPTLGPCQAAVSFVLELDLKAVPEGEPLRECEAALRALVATLSEAQDALESAKSPRLGLERVSAALRSRLVGLHAGRAFQRRLDSVLQRLREAAAGEDEVAEPAEEEGAAGAATLRLLERLLDGELLWRLRPAQSASPSAASPLPASLRTSLAQLVNTPKVAVEASPVASSTPEAPVRTTPTLQPRRLASFINEETPTALTEATNSPRLALGTSPLATLPSSPLVKAKAALKAVPKGQENETPKRSAKPAARPKPKGKRKATSTAQPANQAKLTAFFRRS